MKTILKDLWSFTIGLMLLTGLFTWIVWICSFINIMAE